MQRKTFRIRGLFEYLIALVIILDCNSVWNNIRETREWFQYFLLIILYVGVFGCLLAVGKFKTSLLYKTLFFVGLFCLYFAFFLVINTNSIVTGVVNMLLALCALLVYFYLCVDEKGKVGLLLKFRDVMVIIAFISLIFWILGPVMELIQPTGVYLTNWTGNNNETQIKSYFDIFFVVQNISFFDMIYIARNTAFFNEAPMASLCLSVALMIDMLYDRSQWRWARIILMIALATTFSTAGYILLAILCVFEFIKNRPQQKLLYFVKVLIIPVSFVTAIVVALVLVEEKLSTFSGMARLDDYTSGFKAWLTNPFMGDGFGSMDAMTKARPIWRQSAGGFNSGIMAILVQCGLYGVVIYLGIIISAILRGIKYKKIQIAVFSMLFFFLLLVTVIPYNYLSIMMLMVLAVGFSKSKINMF